MADNEGAAQTANTSQTSPAAPSAAAPANSPLTGVGQQAAQPPLDLDALLNEVLPKPPEGQKSHTGIDPKKVIEGLPEDARKMVANLRDDYRRKTDSIAQERKALQTQQASWLAQQESALRQQMDIPEDIDLFSPDGLQKFIQAKVAAAMLEAQKPLRANAAVASRREELAKFHNEHPDTSEYKDRIIQLVASGMKPEDAYWRAKGEAADTRVTAAQKEAAALKAEAAKKAANGVKSTGIGAAVAPGSVGGAKPKTAWEAFQLIQSRNGG